MQAGQFQLYQNFPNPFNPVTTIRFYVVNSNHVTLKLFNVLGQELATVVSANMYPGMHQTVFDASAVPTGVYFYRLAIGQFNSSKAMILAK